MYREDTILRRRSFDGLQLRARRHLPSLREVLGHQKTFSINFRSHSKADGDGGDIIRCKRSMSESRMYSRRDVDDDGSAALFKPSLDRSVSDGKRARYMEGTATAVRERQAQWLGEIMREEQPEETMDAPNQMLPAETAPMDEEDVYLASRTIRTKGSWSTAEDKLLLRLTKTHGAKGWAQLAEHFPTKTAKQCRDRWHNQLNPSIIDTPWTREEDALLITLNRQIGNRWSAISKSFPGRTPNAVKNHFNSSVRPSL